jgi:CRP-like cAMP-binding protein
MRSGNELIDALPASVRQRDGWLADLPQGHPLVMQRAPITHAFFPVSAVCSITIELASGQQAQVALVGSEGCTGVRLALGAPVNEGKESVVVAGRGYLLRAEQLIALCGQHERFRQAVLRHASYRLALAARLAACNAHHPLRQRLARWLLVAQDRVGNPEIPFTHGLLAAMVGGTRPRVSLAAGELKSAGAIEYTRGVLRVLDRRQLSALSCECYEEAKPVGAE